MQAKPEGQGRPRWRHLPPVECPTASPCPLGAPAGPGPGRRWHRPVSFPKSSLRAHTSTLYQAPDGRAVASPESRGRCSRASGPWVSWREEKRTSSQPGLLLVGWLVFRATGAAYGSSQSQARGQIRAIAAGLRNNHRNVGSEPHLQPTPQLMAAPDP